MIDDFDSDFERAQYLQNMLISDATGGTAEDRDYQTLRRLFVSNPETKDLLPSFVKTNRDLAQFWQFIKHKFDHYAERRGFIYSEFTPLLDFLEGKTPAPADNAISDALRSFDEEGVHSVWSKALERRASDPEGAITAARTLLETVCKHILDVRGIEYDSQKIELPALYKLASKELNLSPSQHTQEVFKQILGGCSGVVNGLGTLRNRLGDAHGQGKLPVRPAPRHAELAVNLSGSVALFLVATFQEQLEKKT
jgi:hypothetical protein